MKCYGKCYSEGGVVLYFNNFIGSVMESVIVKVVLWHILMFYR